MTDLQSKLIVGLGNPGLRYARNRHNIGFMVLDELARRMGLDLGHSGANHAWAAGPGCILLRPLTFMNLSGEALVSWALAAGVELCGRAQSHDASQSGPPAEAFSAPAQNPEPSTETVRNAEEPQGLRPLVVCDDLALPFGSVRLRARGSSGGQNGLASIIDHLGGEEFPRLRLGIAPLDEAVPPEQWPAYVLADFDDEQATAVEELVSGAADAVEFWLEHGTEATISRHNRRIRPSN